MIDLRRVRPTTYGTKEDVNEEVDRQLGALSLNARYSSDDHQLPVTRENDSNVGEDDTCIGLPGNSSRDNANEAWLEM